MAVTLPAVAVILAKSIVMENTHTYKRFRVSTAFYNEMLLHKQGNKGAVEVLL